MTRIFQRNARVVVCGGLHHGRRGKVLTPNEGWADRVELQLDTIDKCREVAWVNAYLLEPEGWEDR